MSVGSVHIPTLVAAVLLIVGAFVIVKFAVKKI